MRVALLIGLLLLNACGAGGPLRTVISPEPTAPHDSLPQNGMLGRLRDVVDAATLSLEDTGRRIAASTDDYQIKRLSVLFRMRAVQAARKALWDEKPSSGVIDVWTLSIQARTHLETGDGRDLFGEFQPLAVEGVRDLELQIEAMVRSVSPKQYQKLRDGVHDFAARYPIEGRFARVSQQPSEAPAAETSAWSNLLPSLNPFGGVSQGIGEGAAAIGQFGRVADRFTDVVQFLPIQLGWQLELFQYDLEETAAIRDTVSALSRAAQSTEAVTEIAENLPTRVRTEIEAAFDSLDPKLDNVRKSLAEAKATFASAEAASAALDKTGTTFEGTARSIESMSAQLDTTLQVFYKVMVLLVGDPDAPPVETSPDEEGRPFDVLDFDQTARSVTAMAAQLDATLARFESLVAGDSLPVASTRATETVESLIWRAALAVVVVLAAFFAMLLGYRRLTAGTRQG